MLPLFTAILGLITTTNRSPVGIISLFSLFLPLCYYFANHSEMNRRDLKIALFCLIPVIFSACSGSILPGSSSGSYYEDLSKTRPRYTFKEEDILVKNAQPEKSPSSTAATRPAASRETASVNRELAEIIQTINQQNKSVRYMPGFRIQVYVGNIRSEADAAKAFVYRSFPELSPYVTFSQPTYRVKAGDFMSKAEAEQVLSSIRLQYTTAVIVPDKIEIEKGLLQAMAEK